MGLGSVRGGVGECESREVGLESGRGGVREWERWG